MNTEPEQVSSGLLTLMVGVVIGAAGVVFWQVIGHLVLVVFR